METPNFDDPGMEFIDWEDKILALPAKSVNLFRVMPTRRLVPVPDDWLISEICQNGVAMSKSEVEKARPLRREPLQKMTREEFLKISQETTNRMVANLNRESSKTKPPSSGGDQSLGENVPRS